MAFSDNQFRDLIAATHHWLSYRHLIGRADRFREATMVEPISDYLSSQVRPWSLNSEYDHPRLQRAGRGRPKQIDFGVLQGDVLKVAIETKWWPCQAVDILEDVLRLDALYGIVNDQGIGRQVDRFLIVAGPRSEREPFRNHQVNAERVRGVGQAQIPYISAFLPMRRGTDLIVRRTELHRRIQDDIDAFFSRTNEGKEPAEQVRPFSRLKITALNMRRSQQFFCYGWKIQRQKGRGR